MSSELTRILYLEDDPHIAEVGQMALIDFGGLEVLHCLSGFEALRKFEEYKPDLLLFDVMLPEMDGVQTLAEIRKLEDAGSETPVIFMTAKAQKHEQKHYTDLGALDVVVKPFDALTLADTLRETYANSVAEQGDAA